ncbi:MAG: hypothetical protein F6K19_27870 [Cyanothece sp. SIO1E1]|nr:hypothetical protein [Cyanothece sp. SIO1E1]
MMKKTVLSGMMLLPLLVFSGSRFDVSTDGNQVSHYGSAKTLLTTLQATKASESNVDFVIAARDEQDNACRGLGLC